MRLQEDHHIFYRALFVPGLDDICNALVADAQDLAQPLRLVVDQLQRIVAKKIDDAFRHHRANAANEARAQVALDALCGCRQRLFEKPRLLAFEKKQKGLTLLNQQQVIEAARVAKAEDATKMELYYAPPRTR